MASTVAFLLAASLAILSPSLSDASVGSPVADGLDWGFHSDACPDLEDVVHSSVAAALQSDLAIAAGLLRIFFHDCFVQGCDASVLLGGESSEQKLGPNETLQPKALKLIDDIRGRVHAACGPTVSCADITTLATRDAVLLSGGPFYDVPLGRRDALSPAPQDKVFRLPGPDSDVGSLLQLFNDSSLDAADLVALSGAHTVGRAHCRFFSGRLPPNVDPTIDPRFAKKLAAACAKDDGKVTVPLDARTPDAFDNRYYVDLVAKQGVFTSDQGLMNDGRTKRMATRFALNQGAFFGQFAKSMVKLSQLGVLTGNLGEVRLNCAAPNGRSIVGTAVAGDEGFAAVA